MIFVIEIFFLAYLIFYSIVEPLERVDPINEQKTGGPPEGEKPVCVCVRSEVAMVTSNAKTLLW